MLRFGGSPRCHDPNLLTPMGVDDEQNVTILGGSHERLSLLATRVVSVCHNSVGIVDSLFDLFNLEVDMVTVAAVPVERIVIVCSARCVPLYIP